MKAAEPRQITDELSIRLVTAPYFAATKLEALHGRGEGDYQLSHDMEDPVALVDGRPSLQQEIDAAYDALQSWLREQVEALLEDPGFERALPGHLPGDKASQARLPRLLWRLNRLAAASDQQALLRLLLDEEVTKGYAPEVREFRSRHEDHRALIDELVARDLVRLHRGRYVLTLSGLAQE